MLLKIPENLTISSQELMQAISSTLLVVRIDWKGHQEAFWSARNVSCSDFLGMLKNHKGLQLSFVQLSVWIMPTTKRKIYYSDQTY